MARSKHENHVQEFNKLARQCRFASEEKRQTREKGNALIAESQEIIAKANAEGRTEATPQEEQRLKEIQAELARCTDAANRIARISEKGIAKLERMKKELERI